ncbi:FtsX-like permease family protein [Marisediminicola sp. LYQ85]|uniref:ABC transporter permease n=1 Tax=Marisediminicola sp. LYQ85 TaxID=3391062 RepID=UPI0039839077
MNPREHTSSIVVSALSSFFGVSLIQATGLITDVVGPMGDGAIQLALVTVAGVFILLAMYTGAVVTANTFGTIVAGRVRTIALMRLVGASTRQLRASIGREGLVVGAVGSLIGAVLALVTTNGAARYFVSTGDLPDIAYRLIDPLVILPVVAVVVTTWSASLVGSRKVLSVTPIQATASAGEPDFSENRRRTGRNVIALLLIASGVVLLVVGVVVGLVSPLGMFIAFFGGVGSFTGIILGAHVVMPLVLKAVGALFGRGAAGRLAALNALRYPARSTRATIGLVIGVTLVMTFTVAAASYQQMILDDTGLDADQLAEANQVLGVTFGVLSALIGFSAVIAAVGLVNNLSLGVLQRTRELGLLRALGFTSRQVRRMIVAESAQMVIASVGLGLGLGVLYGWAGAQSLLGSIFGSELVAPSVPWQVVVGIVGGAAVLAVVASLAPSRRATSVSPVRALQTL